MKLHTISFGCQMSVRDGEEMARPWLERGFEATDDAANADAIIMSTCTVRQHAEDRAVSAIGRLRKWKEERPDRFLIVAGCAAERIGDWIQNRFPHVDMVVGARAIDQYPKLLDEAVRDRFDWEKDNAGSWEEGQAPRHAPGSAYVTIMRGCNYSCTYCIVPSVRGREIYRSLDTVLDEVREHVAAGALEITLLGQTVNSYRDPQGHDFARLLRAVDAIEGVKRLRFTSPHPFYLTDAVMDAMAECPSVTPHLHLPAQSGSDTMLQAMRRNYTFDSYLEKVNGLRSRISDLALSTDLIVGFPGETEKDFQATLRLVREADFCGAYCYKFSPRQTTPAATMMDQIGQPVKEERLARLLEATETQTKKHLAAMVGRKVTLLLEDETDGRTQYHFKGRLEAPGKPGTLVDAEVAATTATALKCRGLVAAGK